MQRLYLSFKTCVLENPHHAPLLLQFLHLCSLSFMCKIAIKHRVNVLLIVYVYGILVESEPVFIPSASVDHIVCMSPQPHTNTNRAGTSPTANYIRGAEFLWGR